MKCWICGAKASSREHVVKASDLKLQFGNFSQRHPLYQHSGIRKNVRVGSLKSDKLKFSTSICARCNNERTQPFDLAWEKFSSTLQGARRHSPPAQRVRVKSIFPGASEKSMRYVHLYFVKLFGCRIVESGIPIDIQPFSKAILTGKPHPYLFLEFGVLKDVKGKHAGITPIQSVNTGGQSVFATFMYSVGKIGVALIFTVLPKNRTTRDAWHPSQRLRVVELKNFTA